jgi:hypothetical protein
MVPGQDFLELQFIIAASNPSLDEPRLHLYYGRRGFRPVRGDPASNAELALDLAVDQELGCTSQSTEGEPLRAYTTPPPTLSRPTPTNLGEPLPFFPVVSVRFS